MGRRRNIETAGLDKGTLKIVVVALGHTCGVRVQAPFGVHSEHDLCVALLKEREVKSRKIFSLIPIPPPVS